MNDEKKDVRRGSSAKNGPCTNFERWTESPSALLAAFRTFKHFERVLDEGLVDFEGWCASYDPIPPVKGGKPAICTAHSAPHPCTLVRMTEVMGEPYAEIIDGATGQLERVPRSAISLVRGR